MKAIKYLSIGLLCTVSLVLQAVQKNFTISNISTHSIIVTIKDKKTGAYIPTKDNMATSFIVEGGRSGPRTGGSRVKASEGRQISFDLPEQNVEALIHIYPFMDIPNERFVDIDFQKAENKMLIYNDNNKYGWLNIVDIWTEWGKLKN